MNKSFILALDIGTSSVRAAIYDLNAEPVPHMSVKIERGLRATADGGSEIDADEATRDKFCAKGSPSACRVETREAVVAFARATAATKHESPGLAILLAPKK